VLLALPGARLESADGGPIRSLSQVYGNACYLSPGGPWDLVEGTSVTWNHHPPAHLDRCGREGSVRRNAYKVIFVDWRHGDAVISTRGPSSGEQVWRLQFILASS